jgi:hypothetical protein
VSSGEHGASRSHSARVNEEFGSGPRTQGFIKSQNLFRANSVITRSVACHQKGKETEHSEEVDGSGRLPATKDPRVQL